MDGWQVIAVAFAAMVAVAALVVWAHERWIVRPLRAQLRVSETRLAASKASTVDVGYLMARQRAGFEEQTRVYEAILDIALDGAAGLIAERDAAREEASWADLQVDIERERRASTVALLLTFYGREVERADAAELELERERIVSAGLEALGRGLS